jgi:DNA polymerase-3 subunit alpha
MIELSQIMNLSLIATTDAHMVDHEDLSLHQTLTNIGGHNTEGEESVYECAYMMTQEEILNEKYNIPPIALQNAYELAERVDIHTFEDTSYKYPIFQLPEGKSPDEQLKELAVNGLYERLLSNGYIENVQEYHDRLNYELEVIKGKKIAAYFLIVHDYVNWAQSKGILTGPGRGSGAGSLTLYSLKITNLDPIRWDLLFERMLNPQRHGFPDIDQDLQDDRRHEVIEYLQEKYGSEHIAQIGTYGTMAVKGILKDVGRALNLDYDYINEITTSLPDNLKWEDMLEMPETQGLQQKYPQLIQVASNLIGTPKSQGLHPCGTLVAPNDLFSSIPLYKGKNGEIVTMYEGPQLEEVG